jgi:hypothetical protein
LHHSLERSQRSKSCGLCISGTAPLFFFFCWEFRST